MTFPCEQLLLLFVSSSFHCVTIIKKMFLQLRSQRFIILYPFMSNRKIDRGTFKQIQVGRKFEFSTILSKYRRYACELIRSNKLIGWAATHPPPELINKKIPTSRQFRFGRKFQKFDFYCRQQLKALSHVVASLTARKTPISLHRELKRCRF